ncbi:uncharacterized protein LOC113867714 isoform X2 [Abrus precatorius]|uniref:Uncharacterized protein LOC113867714 isoform X2 n=1 Tax=Abrus precatorius TaxID=3816 RepID=A0A8B8LRN3_ABRPR|nr:uncharacterized protein LOC113867714 isoform X2 [Abrus precatorius]
MALKTLLKPTLFLTLRVNISHHFHRPNSLPSTTKSSNNTHIHTHLCCYKFNTAIDGSSKGYLDLNDEELMRQCEMDTFKSSGPGGQHRNKRESAVRLKHLPTGIIAQASEERSQHKNRASALNRLRSLIALKGKQWIVMLICRPESFFRYFLPNHPLEGRIVVHKLDLITQNLHWSLCPFLFISFLFIHS